MDEFDLHEDLKAMALEELTRHYGIKSPTPKDIRYVTHLLKKMPIIQSAFRKTCHVSDTHERDSNEKLHS